MKKKDGLIHWVLGGSLLSALAIPTILVGLITPAGWVALGVTLGAAGLGLGTISKKGKQHILVELSQLSEIPIDDRSDSQRERIQYLLDQLK